MGPATPPELHCMTLNVRRPVPYLRRGRPDAWETRRPALRRLIAAESPSVLAVQEAFPEQVDALREALGDDHEPVLVGRRPDGSGERVGLFVDRARLRLVDQRIWAVSRRPGRLGSRSWGALFPRAAVAAVLEDRSTGVRFAAVATHLDPFSPAALRHGARQVAATIAELGLPTVAMADWNSGPRSPAARELAAVGLRDTWETSLERTSPAVGTLTGYRRPRPDGPRIDRILMRDDGGRTARVDRVGISTRAPGGGAFSDHAAVHAVLRWEEA